ncbi:hypothetical protein H0R92_01265 [Treponema sp. OMZ 840]|uniref:hypothetical protein n=1 Tax=Treponema sp. OMZ 840 TaxID=244313 RepID=UPI003D8A8601
MYTIDINAAEHIVLGERWALITDPYAAYRIKPSDGASIVGHGRQGDIIQVKGTAIAVDGLNAKRSLWYQFSTGWLPEKTIQVYSNKLKAEFAAEKIK